MVKMVKMVFQIILRKTKLPKTNSTGVTSERALEVMNINKKTKL